MEFPLFPAYDMLLKRLNRLGPRKRLCKMEPTPNSLDKKYILFTAREAADYLRVSLSTLSRMERRGMLRPLRTPGGHRRYTLEMLNESLSQQSANLG